MYIRPDYHENGIYHVYNRGVNRRKIFKRESDYFDFREILRYFLIGFPDCKVSDTLQHQSPFSMRWRMKNKPVSFTADPKGNGMFKNIIELLAYCLMPNHFHFLIRICKVSDTLQSPISEFMKRIGITYAHKFNHDNQRVGPLFQGRFKIKELDTDERVMHVSRYIHINPTMAGLVNKPENWQWSNINDYYLFPTKTPFSISKPKFVIGLFRNRPTEYREFVEAQFSNSDSTLLRPVAIDAED
ncbi:transposase [Candidatus Collierbacteria bacterium]|nr:transposase [Candidatus Collierbacteria bacterium]